MKWTLAALFVVAAMPGAAHAQTLTVYSSLPLSGAARGSARAVNDGARIALERTGATSVRLVALDDATKQAGTWTPERAAANARRAIEDPAAIAYLGAFNSGASAVALPILNDGGVPMISPSNTYNGLTIGGPGTGRGEPDKYYPTGVRTYFRLLPNDALQGAALATAMRDRGCRRIALLNDREDYGRGLASYVRVNGKRLGLRFVLNGHLSRDAGRRVRRSGADCMAFTGIAESGAVPLFRSMPARIRLFGSDGVADADFAAALPRSVAERTLVMLATRAPQAYGLPAGTDPFMAMGFEAMKVILDGVAAGARTKTAMVSWLHGVRDRPSALGPYGFNGNGDTTLRTYGLYAVTRRALRYAGAVNAA